MYFWAKECPQTIVESVSVLTAPSADLSIAGNATAGTQPPVAVTGVPRTVYRFSIRSREVFKVLILKVWKAYCTPRARHDKILTSETVEQAYLRETLIRNRSIPFLFQLFIHVYLIYFTNKCVFKKIF